MLVYLIEYEGNGLIFDFFIYNITKIERIFFCIPS